MIRAAALRAFGRKISTVRSRITALTVVPMRDTVDVHIILETIVQGVLALGEPHAIVLQDSVRKASITGQMFTPPPNQKQA